jgi:hypothetical protein
MVSHLPKAKGEGEKGRKRTRHEEVLSAGEPMPARRAAVASARMVIRSHAFSPSPLLPSLFSFLFSLFSFLFSHVQLDKQPH